MVSKKRKQKIKLKSNGQKSLKTCKVCGSGLNPFSESDYCSDECEKRDKSVKEVVLDG